MRRARPPVPLLCLGLLAGAASLPLAAAPARAQSAGPAQTPGMAQTLGMAQPSGTAGEPDGGGRRAQERQADPIRAFDIEKDGRLDVAECKSAAAARFDELNPDADDNLDPREAAPVLDAQAFRLADTNGDGQVNKAEYLAYVERLFREADADKNETLVRAELDSERGRALLRLLR